MLTQEQLARLHESVKDSPVLSVYIDARENDPAERREWRVRLRHMIDTLDEQAAGEEKSARKALAHIEGELDAYPGLLPGPGWVAFATPDRLLYAGATPAPVPDLLRWDEGLHVAPYVRALKQWREVIVVIADHVRARRFSYRLGELHEEETLESAHSATRGEFGSSKRAGHSSGVRGEPRTDAAQRHSEAWTDRLIRDIVAEVTNRTVPRGQDDPLIVVSGDTTVVSAVLDRLAEPQRARAIAAHGLRPDASDAEIREAVESAASALSARLQDELVASVIDAARSDGRACLGQQRVERALEAGAVDTLVLSRSFSRNDPDLANRLVRATVDQSGSVDEVGNAAGDALDEVGGVAARLRFAV